MTDEPVQGRTSPARLDQAEAIRRQVALSRWHEAENKVYPLVMVDPAMYEAALTAIGGISARLRAAHTSQAELFDLDVDVLAFEVTSDEAIAASVLASHLPVRLLVEAALAKTRLELPE